MKLATTSGLRTLRERRWPLAGIDAPAGYANGNHLIELASSPSSPQNFATFASIYRSNPWVFAAVQAISWSLSRLQLKLYQRMPDGSVRHIRPAPAGAIGRPTLEQELAALLEMPEPGVSAQEWLRKLVVDKLVYGNSLCSIEAGRSSAVPEGMYHTAWRKVEVDTGDLVPILKYTVRGSKTQREFRPDEVIHFGRSGDLDSPLGLSPIQPLKYTVALHDALSRHLNNYFKNAARPSGILRVTNGSDEKKLKLIQKAVEELYSAPENAGKIMVTSAEWQSMAQDPQSSQIIELAKLSREEIAGVFQVPPPVLGILERAIQANVVELRSQFLRDVVGPHAAGIEGDLNAQLIWRNPRLKQLGLFVGFDMMQALRPDLTELSTVFEKLRHVLTPEEMRELIGYAPLSGNPMVDRYMQTVWMPSGQIPLGLPQPQTKGAFEQAATMEAPVPVAQPQPQPAAVAEQAPYA